jgi:hypothetical protein
MRTSTERAAHTFAAALGMMVAPSLAPSAHDRAGVGACSGHAAIHTGDSDELTDELLCRSSRYGVFYIDPCDHRFLTSYHYLPLLEVSVV